MTATGPLDLGEVTVTELRHRIKNLIAIVQALVAQTLRSSTSAEGAAKVIDERLAAISRSVDVLLRSDWAPLELGELIDLGLTHRAAFGERVSVTGPHVMIGADWAVMMVLALHELETNAIKYGALSEDGGRVELRWTVLEQEEGTCQLCLQWTETGGPEVRSDGRAGFGSRLATTLLQRHLGGLAEIYLLRGGLTWQLRTTLPASTDS